MREQDMRQRVEHFLQTRLRRMLAPATLGLGLAMTGCPSSGLDATEDAGALVDRDAPPDQSPTMKYMAQIPDAGRDGPVSHPDYMAQMPDAQLGVPIYSAPAPDAMPPVRYGAQMRDAGPDEREIVALYMAQLPLPRS